MSETYKIGEIRAIQDDMKCISGLTGEIIKTYPKGTEFLVSANGYCVFPDNKLLPIPEGVKVKGYNTEAIAHRIMRYLKRDTSIADIIDEEDEYCNEKVFRDAIEEALYDIF